MVGHSSELHTRSRCEPWQQHPPTSLRLHSAQPHHSPAGATTTNTNIHSNSRHRLGAGLKAGKRNGGGAAIRLDCSHHQETLSPGWAGLSVGRRRTGARWGRFTSPDMVRGGCGGDPPPPPPRPERAPVSCVARTALHRPAWLLHSHFAAATPTGTPGCAGGLTRLTSLLSCVGRLRG